MQVGQTFGPFFLEKELGSGAMGTVYRAIIKRDGKPDKVVALKVIAFNLASNDTAVKRFEREGDILKQLKHPNIVRYVGHGKTKEVPFFAMEYVEGNSLDKIIVERQAGIPGKAPFTWEEVVEMGRPLCDALQHAHDKGIIHRDLKPSNLMLTTEGVMKLTDFGIAKDIDVTALTGANNTIGTAAYMSPEQCKGEKHLTGKSDIYSLGVVFYELLTGRKPFQAESSVDMFLAHVSAKFVRPAQVNPTIPIWLDTLVCQMMEKKPEHRPRDAAMVGQVLGEIVDKMVDQKSVGADLATAKGVTGGSSDDRVAAKLIRAGAKKKKLRKKKQAIYTKGWFVGLAAVLFVGTVVALVWFVFLAPPSAEKLYARIEAQNDSTKKLDAIADYLKHYGTSSDANLEKVKSLERELKVKDREGVLLRRHGRDNLRAHGADDDDPEAYRKTMAALTAENEGDIPAARTAWNELVRDYANQSDSTKALWGWHAQKKLNDLAATQSVADQLVAKMNDMRLDDKDVVFEDDLDKKVLAGIRLERLGDFALAHTRWSQLAETLKGDAARRSLVVFAKGRMRELEPKRQQPKDSAERAKLLRKVLDDAGKLPHETFAEKAKVRAIYRDVRDLYAGETGEVSQVVEAAKKLLAG